MRGIGQYAIVFKVQGTLSCRSPLSWPYPASANPIQSASGNTLAPADIGLLSFLLSSLLLQTSYGYQPQLPGILYFLFPCDEVPKQDHLTHRWKHSRFATLPPYLVLSDTALSLLLIIDGSNCCQWGGP